MNNSESSPSTPLPLLAQRPAEEEEGSSHSKRQMQMVTSTSPFKLPHDWYIEKKRRPVTNTVNPGQIDKYYHEPGTGLKFRSLAAVKRYLTGSKIDTRSNKLKPGSECNMQITPRITRSSSSFVLPGGWKIEEKQRSNINYSGVIDKTYIEPRTGRRFRSLLAVERYLTEANKETPLQILHGSGSPMMKNLGEMRSQKVVSSSLKRNISGENNRPSKLNLGNPPAKVKWALAGPGGNMWNPIMGNSMVADSVKQKWSETFLSSINGGNISAPSF